jgi:hypothetical protein
MSKRVQWEKDSWLVFDGYLVSNHVPVTVQIVQSAYRPTVRDQRLTGIDMYLVLLKPLAPTGAPAYAGGVSGRQRQQKEI